MEMNGKSALVLQGGAMRGIYTAGVLDAFLEQGVEGFDFAAGVSAGAIHGCSYISRQHGRNISYFAKYCRDKRFMSWRNLLRTGDFFDVEFGYHEIPDKLYPFDHAAFAANPTQFYAVVTDIDTGLPVYHLCTDLKGDNLEFIRASASMPLASRVVTISGRRYLDGGIADNVPYAWAKKQGSEKTVVVLTQPAGYRKQPSSNAAMRLRYEWASPVLASMMALRTDLYNAQLAEIEQAEAAGECFVICPSENLHLKRTENDPARLKAQYELGRRDALAKMAALREYLRK